MHTPVDLRLSRRVMLRGAILSGGALFTGFDGPRVQAILKRLTPDAVAEGQQIGQVPFINEGSPEMDAATGAELEGRLYTDLSNLSVDSFVIPTGKFYLRTRASELLPELGSWKIRLTGMAKTPIALLPAALKTKARSMGVHLMECAGNPRVAHFGMIGVAQWTGVSLMEVLHESGALPNTKQILVSGFDRYASKSTTSVPGASWIFTPDQLKAAGAFLATEMNDAPLTRDHGAPVRLVVPGWYGCTCIKWVDQISIVSDSAEATSQMQEYAGRTRQKGIPHLAKDFAAASIDFAAMPVRVEKWTVGDKLQYRVVGISWGGTRPAAKLKIRFNPEEEFVPVSRYEAGDSRTWSLWEHVWLPKQPGTYNIRLSTDDAGVAARRMEAGYYVRAVEINEV